MFVGTHLVGVDQKGRASVPASFRAALKGAETVYVWPSYKGPWLEAGDHAYLEKIRTALDARGEFDDVRDDFDYAIFAAARALSCDDTGRVSLDAELRAHAGLDRKAAFVGRGERFEVWSPDAFEARRAAAMEAARANEAALRRPGAGP
jgi:MraZ protein